MPYKESLASYRKEVAEAFDKKLKININNGSSEHAAIIYENIFSHAKKDVSIFCKNLSPDVFQHHEVIEAIQNAFVNNPNLNVRIIVEDDVNVAAFSEMVGNLDYGVINIFKLNQDIADSIKYNLAVADSGIFRFEPSNTQHEALASANNSKYSIPLRSLFEDLLNNATALAVA